MSESHPPAKSKKPRSIPRKVVEMADLLLDGRARNLSQAAEIVGCTRQYASQVFKKRPDCVVYLQQRAARALGISAPVAASKMAALIHSDSDHVAFRASEHVLGVNGIKPARDPQVNIGITVGAGYIIDLRQGDNRGPLPDLPIEEGRPGYVVDDGMRAAPRLSEGQATEIKPPEVTKLRG